MNTTDTETETETGMLDEEDRRKARDLSRWLLDGVDAIRAATPDASRLDVRQLAAIRDASASVRDLDAVACGPVSR